MIKKVDYSFASEWKENSRFIDITYSDFINLLIESNKRYYFSHKVDGELNALIYEKNKRPYFVTKSGVIRDRNYPVLDEYWNILKKYREINNMILIGELIAEKGRKQLSFNLSQSVIQTGNVNDVYHYIFEVYRINGNPVRIDFPKINQFFKSKSGHIKIPKWKYGGINEFKEMWSELVLEKGYEGIVARDPDNQKIFYRIKLIQTFDSVIMSVGQEGMSSWARNQISYMRLALMDEQGNFLLTSKVGTGFGGDIGREKFFKWANENYIEKRSGELWIPPMKVMECQYRRYRFANVPLLRYDRNKRKYQILGTGSGVMLDQVSFLRERPDKKIKFSDISIEQFPKK